MIFLVGGLPGAGKSTYSKKLADSEHGIVFSMDVWMNDLYWPDMSPGGDFSWALERTQRCEKRMIMICSQLAKIKVSAILDIGFVNLKYRKLAYSLLDSLDLDYEVHFLNVEKETRWSRIEQRNREKGETFSFEVTRDMFDFMEGLFDEFTTDETSKKVISISDEESKLGRFS